MQTISGTNFLMLLFVVAFVATQGLLHTTGNIVRVFSSSSNAISKDMKLYGKYGVPMELLGYLDPKKKHTVKFIFNGEEKTVEVPEDVSFLEMGENLWRNAPSSCRNGVCTMCAGEVKPNRKLIAYCRKRILTLKFIHRLYLARKV